jgi:hypothetical protein
MFFRLVLDLPPARAYSVSALWIGIGEGFGSQVTLPERTIAPVFFLATSAELRMQHRRWGIPKVR